MVFFEGILERLVFFFDLLSSIGSIALFACFDVLSLTRSNVIRLLDLLPTALDVDNLQFSDSLIEAVSCSDLPLSVNILNQPAKQQK